MSSTKTERLLNLVICLLSTRRPLSKAQIRSAVPQYGESTSMDAFERMFERDKDELRDLGIPLATTHADPLFDDEVGYRIDRDAYALPEVTFEPDEGGTQVTVAHTSSEHVPDGGAEQGWNDVLDRLVRVCAGTDGQSISSRS